jgi:hypothetical protein
MSASDSTSNARSRTNGASWRAVKPAGSMARKSLPDPFTNSAVISSPNTVLIGAFTEVLPPPCKTKLPSSPISRET